MAIALRAGASGLTSLTIPASTQAGDILLLVAGSYSNVPTTPSGWTQVGSTINGSSTYTNYQACFYKVATAQDAGTTVTVPSVNTNYGGVLLAVVSGADAGVAPQIATNAGNSDAVIEMGPITPTRKSLVLAAASQMANSGSYNPWVSQPGGWDLVALFVPSTYGAHGMWATPSSRPAGTAVPQTSAQTTYAGGSSGMMIAVAESPIPVATPSSPINNAVIDHRATVRLSWTYSSPISSAQASSEVRYRLAGTTTWTAPAAVSSANAFRDFAVGTFTPGMWEWQVRTTDAAGNVGDWAPSATFIVAANRTRLRPAFVNGVLDADITSSATTLTSASFSTLPAVGPAQELMVVIDPGGVAGAPEVVRVVGHAGGSNTITVERAADGSTARGHLATTRWAVAPLPSDLVQVIASDTRNEVEQPSDFALPLVRHDFKDAGKLGLEAGYCQLVTRAIWGDDSGGGVYQEAYHQNGRVYFRYGTRAVGWGAWQSATGGGLQLLGTIQVAGLALGTYGSVRFTGIPTWAKRLYIRARGLRNTGGNSNTHLYVRFNGDTAANYAAYTEYWTTSTPTGTTLSAQSTGFLGYNYFYVGSSYGDSEFDVDINNGVGRRTWQSEQLSFMSPTVAQYPYGSRVKGMWMSEAPITQIDIWNSAAATWTAGEIALYGSTELL